MRRSAKEFVERWGRRMEMDEGERLAFHNDAKNRYATVLELVPSGARRILDVGAGSGLLSFLLGKWCHCEVEALDFFPVRRRWAGEEVRVRRCDVERERFPFPDESFDCVVCSEVLEHLLHSPHHMLEESRRVLREGGVLILTTPNAVKLAVRLKVLLGKELCHYRSFYASPPPDRHHKEYTLSEVRELLLEHGFRVERIFCRNTTSWRGPSRYASPGRRLLMDLLLAATHLWPTFKELIFARAEKP